MRDTKCPRSRGYSRVEVTARHLAATCLDLRALALMLPTSVSNLNIAQRGNTLRLGGLFLLIVCMYFPARSPCLTREKDTTSEYREKRATCSFPWQVPTMPVYTRANFWHPRGKLSYEFPTTANFQFPSPFRTSLPWTFTTSHQLWLIPTSQ